MLVHNTPGKLNKCNLSVVEFEELLMDHAWSGADGPQFHNISFFGLYAVLCGLLSIIFSAQASRTIQRQLPVLERALSRWKLLWDRSVSQAHSQELERAGIMMSASEVWLLGRAFLHMESKDFLDGLDSDSMINMESLASHVKKALPKFG
ncbi:uncharacterized protein NFIA_043840 [Aspergillus fischeri NRRL 181]|uniref:Transcription factor domain-containing protein n=1 Tax=Neosartorya fischeri (strain ATCC 1020 / DSM 3700 / CBS 544.65 / FGSC A1164 / JCM 1740 / NRRL 181 / WB 181) TaxID=331117 RepID=A1CUY8_NEOFI|nr:uncharacterized protein NFIA_043840 [Aspergillus fischeri NRRL 181]EAW25565.1 hypothetical protein NFIA_043840 [Aspergillus fischeri NRRL 181]